MRERQVTLTGTGATLRPKAPDRRTGRAPARTEGRPEGRRCGQATPAERDRREGDCGEPNTRWRQPPRKGTRRRTKTGLLARAGRHSGTGAKARGERMRAPTLVERDHQRAEGRCRARRQKPAGEAGAAALNRRIRPRDEGSTSQNRGVIAEGSDVGTRSWRRESVRGRGRAVAVKGKPGSKAATLGPVV